MPVETPILTTMFNLLTVADASTIALLPVIINSPVAVESSVEAIAVTPVLRYNDLQAIYQRYTTARHD